MRVLKQPAFTKFHFLFLFKSIFEQEIAVVAKLAVTHFQDHFGGIIFRIAQAAHGL